jgi:nitrile hydratase accessory protein
MASVPEPTRLDLLEAQGPAAPPRKNGELVFQAPWESRLFGVTVLLHRAGFFEWEEFRRLLIDEIRRWEDEQRDPADWSYYQRWQAAFEKLLTAKGLCGATELQERLQALAARPAGHDH